MELTDLKKLAFGLFIRTQIDVDFILLQALKDLDKLNTDKREAIEEENFDKAMECKEQIDTIKKHTYDDIDLMNMLTEKEIKDLGLVQKPKAQRSAPPQRRQNAQNTPNAFLERENTVLPAIT